MRPEDDLYIAEMAEADVRKTLGAQGRAALNARIAADPAFEQAYREYHDMLQSMQEGGRRIAYKTMLSDIHMEMTTPRKSIVARFIDIPQRYLRTAALAAGVALFTSTLTVWTMRSGEPKRGVVLQDLGQVHREISHIKSTQQQQQWQIQQIKESTDAQAAGSPALPQSNYSGTGFALTADGYLLTNYHVVNGAENIQILTRNGKRHAASVVAYEPKTDIALLKVDDEDFRFAKGELPYSFSAGKASLGAPVYTLGFPQDEIVYGEGYIASRNGYEGDSAQYRLELPAGPGQSGAPVIDATGTVVGIIRNKDAQTESTTYAVSSKTLLRLLHDLPKEKHPKLATGGRMSGMSRQQQIEKLQDYTCMVQVYKK